MKRRNFILSAGAIGLGASLGCSRISTAAKPEPAGPRVIPERIGGRTLVELRDEFRRQLFDVHLPFFDRGGDDKQYGGIMCLLDDNGVPVSDEKHIWFQARGIWIYSYLYNHFGRKQRWLETASRTRDFMIKNMYAGDGKWRERVHRDGSPMSPPSQTIYDRLFAAEGLIEFYKATGNKEDLDLAITCIRSASDEYERPDYETEKHPAGTRIQGHSMMFVLVLSQLLEARNEQWSERILNDHIDAVLKRFHYPELNIENEFLDHDYRRVDPVDLMRAGHTVETRWMVMFDALRRGDRAMFDEALAPLQDWIPMCWDFNFGGFDGSAYYALDTDQHRHGSEFKVKSEWSHAEILIACATTLEYTGAPWAADWFGRTLDYVRRVYAHPDMPWTLNVQRDGSPVVSGGSLFPANRRDNYHPPRCMIHCIRSLDRMIENEGRLTPFPKMS